MSRHLHNPGTPIAGRKCGKDVIYCLCMENYLFFDVDRTLLDSYDFSVPESALAAIALAKKNGDHCWLCTGRAPYSLKHVLNDNLEGVIFCGGAGILYHDELIYSVMIPKKTVLETISLAERTGSGLLIQSRERGFQNAVSAKRTAWITEQKKLISEYASQEVSVLLGGDDISLCDGEGIYKMDVYFEEGSDIGRFRREIDPSMNFVCMLSSQGNRRNGGEITMPGIDKGEAVRWLVNYLHGDMRRTYGFGDSLNDLSMMQACSTGIAMGNGEQELKELADYVADGLHEDGIWNAMKHFGII